jgi:hypothetical protein
LNFFGSEKKIQNLQVWLNCIFLWQLSCIGFRVVEVDVVFGYGSNLGLWFQKKHMHQKNWSIKKNRSLWIDKVQYTYIFKNQIYQNWSSKLIQQRGNSNVQTQNLMREKPKTLIMNRLKHLPLGFLQCLNFFLFFLNIFLLVFFLKLWYLVSTYLVLIGYHNFF